MFLAILTGSFLLLFILHCLIRYTRNGRLLSRIPGPKEYPIIGNLYHFQIPNECIMEKIWKMNEEFYPIYKLWSFFTCYLILLNPEDIKVLMTSKECRDKSVPYSFIQDWLSTGLLTSRGKKWQKRRKLLTPVFHSHLLEDYTFTFNKEAQFLVKSLKEEINDGCIVKNLFELIPKHSLNVICETTLGTSLRGKGELENKYRNAVHDFGKVVAYRFSRPWYHISTIFKLSSVGRSQRKLLKTLHSFSRNIIAERKKFHEQTNYKYLQEYEKLESNDVIYEGPEENNKDLIHNTRLCMLDLLIAASVKNNEIDDEGIREEVDTFMFEGHDTTAVALCFALSLFAKYKDVQESIRQEVNMIMQQEKELTISALRKLSYLERCIKESLRLYPSVHIIFRHLSKDLQLKNYLVPAGSACAVNIYSLHRNSRYWPNPNDFDPDRFLPKNMEDRNPFSYIPFSAGSRNCIGQKFAMLELKLFVAYILHNFYIEPVDELNYLQSYAELTLNPSRPLRLKFIPLK